MLASRVALLSGGGPLADPTSLANLVAWGEGSDLGSDGSAIASWLNKTNSGIDPAQAGAGKPTVATVNGLKAALFTAASSQFLSFPAGALGWFNGVAGITMLAVVQPVTLATSQLLAISANTTAAVRARIALVSPNYSVAGRILDADSSWSAAGGVAAIGTPAVVGLAAAGVGPVETLYINGANAGTAATGTSGNYSATDSATITIGAAVTGAAQFLNGYMFAYAMWAATYSLTQVQPIMRRWARLYKVPGTF